ncbi:iron complex outermembrane receptor protein [Wenyingzhuangia heitensis]|uniref:Iron complex outermembrane receptor protein n=1 Tax=Wenyingzhuangia heitensis TaxID=1487859 RepID=A0ABX0U829_9FLAO|nr:TonB-dependent receptor [Wenyingzhuangia heitensis]NIJ45007.1 iron complex outermembrane receptor protein [Wenyingzhuangia heitensis]
MKIILNWCLLLLSSFIFSQSIVLKGKVTDTKDIPIMGATIVIKGLQKGTSTDIDGNYELKINSKNTTLEFSYIGYETKLIKLVRSNQQTIIKNIRLKDSFKNLDEIVISASRSSEFLSEIPASITVVNTKKLEALVQNTTNISEILEATVPGLAVSTGTFSNWGQTLRGRSLLTMIDGIPQSTPLRNGQLGIKSVNANDLKRVEVIKGATSIFGNGGNGGFINYITKTPTSNKNLEGTTNVWGTSSLSNTKDALGYGIYQSLKGRTNKLGYYVSGSFEQTGNKYDAKGKAIMPTYGLDNTKIYSAFAKLVYEISDNESITLNGNIFKSEQDTPFIPVAANITVENENGDNTLTPGYGVIGSIPGEKATGTRLINMRLKYNLLDVFNNTTNFATDVYYQNTENIFFYSDKFEEGGQSVINSEKYGLRPNFVSTINTGNDDLDVSVTYGVDLLRDKTNQGLLDGRLWVPNIELLSWAYYVQTSLKIKESWVVKAGFRYDNLNMNIVDYSTLPYSPKSDGNFSAAVAVEGGKLKFNNPSYNIGVRYIKHKEFIPYVSFSQGFSIADLGSVLRSATVDNINKVKLEPAVTNNYEFGFISNLNKIRIEAVGYFSSSNLGTGVVLDETTNTFNPSTNPQKIFGGEVSIDYRAIKNKLVIGTSYSYVEGVKYDDDTETSLSFLGGDVISAPKLTAYATWNATPKLSTTIRMVNLGDRKRFSPIENTTTGIWEFKHTEFPVEGYTVVNLSVAYQVKPNISTSLGINNLFNEYYIPARGQWAAPLKTFTNVGEGTNAKLSVVYNF